MSKKGVEAEWINTVLKKGTIADKLAAHTLLINDSKNFASLNTLIEMVDPKKCRRQCVMAMTVLRELFLDSLNLSKKNCKFESEDEKKKIRFHYTKFIDHLNIVASDNLAETRQKAIWVLFELLSKHGENKIYIVEKLVNKLGDKVPKLAATAGHFVEKAANHEKDEVRMKTIKCIQRFLKRTTNTTKARYYAISLLSRIKIIKGNYDMANTLIEIYLDLFTNLSKERKVDSKLMNAIITGVQRAFPYAKLKNETFEQHLHNLYTLVHNSNFRMAVVTMVLIRKIVTKRAQLLKCPIEDRYYNLVFGQIIRPDLHTCSKQEAFADLLLSTINEDTVLERKEAFVKRILQVAVNSNPHLANLLLETITKVKGFSTNLTVSANDGDTKMSSDENSDQEDVDAPTNSWVHNQKKHSGKADLLARNARAARPKNLNELYFLRQYCDPKVVTLAKSIVGEVK